jgi:UDP-glucuronate decarboxylase
MIGGSSEAPGLGGAGALRLSQSSARIAVVGAAGWLGMATLELLHRLLGDRFSERVRAFGSTSRTLRLRGDAEVFQAPLDELARLNAAPTHVLHLAFLTQEKAKAMTPEAYRSANRAISSAVLDALPRIGAQSLFVPSSGAVYMADRPEAQASMRLYGELKLEDEARFSRWSDKSGGRLAIGRLFNLSGPYINKQSSYALACFIADALAGRPIQVAATRPVYRSYVAISELMSIVFGTLTDGEGGSITFDTAGDSVYEMSKIAEAVNAALKTGLGVGRPPLTGDEPDFYVGDARQYQALRDLYEVPPVCFARQIFDTADFMKLPPMTATAA